METWSAHQLTSQGEHTLDAQSLESLRLYAQNLKSKNIPVVFTLKHLSKITKTPYLTLLNTVRRRREAANYRIFSIAKRSGGLRYIHSVCKPLHDVHQFINQEILQNVKPHHAAQAFYSGSSIYQTAQKHCGAKWLFQFDLQDFFYSINETAVYRVFKDLGYRPLLAFELARLCTTTRLIKRHRKLLHYQTLDYWNEYKFYNTPHPWLGVLPQGAATSPMLSNLVAKKLDNSLSVLANDLGAVYTRYADDIALSFVKLPNSTTTSNIHYHVKKLVLHHGFHLNKKKTRVAGPGAKKLVLGLLVDGETPRISKATYKRIERLLYASKKFGINETAKHEGFDSALGFYNHLSGLIAFTKSVDKKRWYEFDSAFQNIKNNDPSDYINAYI